MCVKFHQVTSSNQQVVTGTRKQQIYGWMDGWMTWDRTSYTSGIFNAGATKFRKIQGGDIRITQVYHKHCARDKTHGVVIAGYWNIIYFHRD